MPLGPLRAEIGEAFFLNALAVPQRKPSWASKEVRCSSHTCCLYSPTILLILFWILFSSVLCCGNLVNCHNFLARFLSLKRCLSSPCTNGGSEWVIGFDALACAVRISLVRSLTWESISGVELACGRYKFSCLARVVVKTFQLVLSWGGGISKLGILGKLV
ncbi:hypothetical protein TNCV_4066031 [Trichonephila clavipes]|uniref:Uncharacterized protein n=1 Tax=Trichonephila clavipes TaxID=2585209 RepID=A0A8X6W8J9_TRICX|nr:hypothetical protein TNCV_4066031 [Trichonephila clavipes]